ncbi:kinase-like domain-containing protein [Mycena crocata]|nr:kinase-like domain-containing protein [Mycena crocata]
MCGVTQRNSMLPPDQGDLQTSSQANIAETHLDRAIATAKRFGNGPTMSKKTPAGTVLNTSTLLSHEHGGGTPGEDKITVGWAVCNSFLVSYPSNMIKDIKAHLVDTVNLEWGRSNSVPLLPCVSGPVFIKSMAKANKGPTIWLEVYIDSKAFNTRVHGTTSGEDTSSSINSTIGATLGSVASNRKCALSSTSEGVNTDRVNKRSNALGPMKSSFMPMSSSSAITVHQRSSVTLKKVICVVDAITGVAEFEETTKVVSGSICHTAFSKGAMKFAYDFKTSSGEALVVKHFYRVSETDENSMTPPVTVLENREQIYFELQCLAVAGYFLKAFFSSISFAEAWLGEEINHLSRASGTTRIDDSHAGITCNNSVVLADIQGTPAHMHGTDTLVLFDPMTHTLTGDSGIGDFGHSGIQSFIRCHKCNDLCRALSLDQLVPLEDDDSEGAPNNDGASSSSQSPTSGAGSQFGAGSVTEKCVSAELPQHIMSGTVDGHIGTIKEVILRLEFK